MKYQKVPTIVEAIQFAEIIDLGDLGVLAAGDWVVEQADGSHTVWSDEAFGLYFNQTSQDATLTGKDTTPEIIVP